MNRADELEINATYNKKWVRKMWEEGFKELNDFCEWLELSPNVVNKLLKEMNLWLSDPRCSICRYRTHDRRQCLKNPDLDEEDLEGIRLTLELRRMKKYRHCNNRLTHESKGLCLDPSD